MFQVTPPVLRLVPPEVSSSRPTASKCKLTSCDKSTREGKPYCSGHIEHGPYIRKIINELILRDTEAKILDEGGAIPNGGHLVRETMLLLAHNTYTAARLARLLDISHPAVNTLIKLLASRSMAKMGRTERGSITVCKDQAMVA